MTASRILRFDRFELDPYRRSLTEAGDRVAIPTQLLSALIYLIRRRDTEVTRPELRRALYRREEHDTDAALDRCVAALRRILGDDDRRPRLIATRPGVGYRFVGAVAGDEPRAEPDEPPAPRLLGLRPAVGDGPPAGRHPGRQRPPRSRGEVPAWMPLRGTGRRRSSSGG